MPYDAMVELPAYIGKNGPEVISRDNIPLFQQGLMMQQLNSEKLVVEATIEGSYEKALKAFTLNKTVPSMKVAKEVLDDMIEANKVTGPSLSKSNRSLTAYHDQCPVHVIAWAGYCHLVTRFIKYGIYLR